MTRARIFAAILAIALPISLIPEAASATPVREQLPIISALGPRTTHVLPNGDPATLPNGKPALHPTTVKIGDNGEVAPIHPDSSFESGFCLYNSSNYCLSMSPIEWEGVVLGGLKILKALIEIYKTVQGGSDEEQEEETLNGKNHLRNECLGVWQSYARVSMGHCTDKHGVYWQFYQAIPGNHQAVYIWNTYTSEWLTTQCPCQGADVWVTPATKDWQKWEGRILTG